ncbi:MAG: hypothetical protein VX447_19925 [Pseudomonadota bacterium]|uniref:hypothetical protein n=1 Tax=Gallaecimonas pentaromativorans TaxID=584787 RepID=UPI0012ED9676|nr:hypothetical protein [Gallaecimonas pentaromativorans]MED5527005.1 hypothetical protein [Pseudomonadota bacterium]
MSTPWAPVLIILALSAGAEAEALKDPTRPPGNHGQASRQPQAPLVLSAVLQTRPARAIINGQVLTIGDKVQGWTLSHIDKNQVSLVSGSRRELLKLFDDNAVTAVNPTGH